MGLAGLTGFEWLLSPSVRLPVELGLRWLRLAEPFFVLWLLPLRPDGCGNGLGGILI